MLRDDFSAIQTKTSKIGLEKSFNILKAFSTLMRQYFKGFLNTDANKVRDTRIQVKRD